MRNGLAALGILLLLGGCTASGTPPRAGSTLLSVVGTPFLIAFKIPVCAASIAIAAPLAGVSALAPGDGEELRQSLGNGLEQNCGPPYVLSP